MHTEFGELETFPAEFSTRISSYILPHVRSTQPDRKTLPSKIHPKPPYFTYLLYLPLASRPYLLTSHLSDLTLVCLPSDADVSACAAAAPRAALRSHRGRRTVALPHMGGGRAVRAARRGPPCALTSAVWDAPRLSEHLPEYENTAERRDQ